MLCAAAVYGDDTKTLSSPARSGRRRITGAARPKGGGASRGSTSRETCARQKGPGTNTVVTALSPRTTRVANPRGRLGSSR